MDYEGTVECIKSCITSVKGGLPLHSLEADFRDITGEVLRPQKFGFSNLEDLLISIKEVYLNKNILTVRDNKTDHLAKLISSQKGQTKVKPLKKKPVFRLAEPKGVAMRNVAPRLLREREKKLEELVNTRKDIFNVSPSAMTSQNLKQFDQSNNTREEPFNGGMLRGVNSFGTESFSLDGRKPVGRGVAGRGRGRSLSSVRSDESPGGLSGTASPRQNSSSPDFQSVGSESISKGYGGASSISSFGENSESNEPVLMNHQLIGESFLTKVASLILGFKIEASEPRLCHSALDMASCLRRLKQNSVDSDKVILMLGLMDIMKGKDLDSIKPMMVELLKYLQTETKQIIIMTVPVPPCLRKMAKPLKTLTSYNEWLLTLKFPGTNVVDILPYTQNKEKETLDFLCDGLKLDPWNEAACWTFVEALFFSGIAC